MMDVNINFYGHSVTVVPDEIVDNLPDDATPDQIIVAIYEDINHAIEQDGYPLYHCDIEDVIEKVKELLEKRKAEVEE